MTSSNRFTVFFLFPHQKSLKSRRVIHWFPEKLFLKLVNRFVKLFTSWFTQYSCNHCEELFSWSHHTTIMLIDWLFCEYVHTPWNYKDCINLSFQITYGTFDGCCATLKDSIINCCCMNRASCKKLKKVACSSYETKTFQ